jgi:hypothetical protein
MKTICYDLRLKEGVGPINLGMNRKEIISILGEPGLSSNGDYSVRDYYTLMGLHIDYEPETEVCKGIETLNSVELIYKGVDIISLRWGNMYQWMLENDPDLDIRENGYTVISHKLGISTGPRYNEYLEDEVIETIVVFSEGYWPSEEKIKADAKGEVDAMPSLEEMLKEVGLAGFHEP